MVKSKKADEIPLLEKEDESFSKISGERRRNRPEANGDPPISAPLVETISYTVLPDDTLEAISLRYGCTKAELKQTNNLFNDADLITRSTLRVPVRKLLSVPTDLLINIDGEPVLSDTADDQESNSVGDAEAATNALLDRIDRSNEEAVHKVSSIGVRHPPTQEELQRDSDNKLNEFLGNLPPVAVLNPLEIARKDDERRQWCYLGFCLVVVVVIVPVILYYYLGVLHEKFVIP